MKRNKYISLVVITFLLFICTLSGVLSINFNNSFNTLNQYGQTIKMYGYGIYNRDSYFKAPILIGTDINFLFLIIPIFILRIKSYIKEEKNLLKKIPSLYKLNLLNLISILALIFYYAASICFGVTYNKLFLAYLILFSLSLFNTFSYIRKWKYDGEIKLTNGRLWFLIISGLALFIAWLPDIISSIISNSTLPLIEVYTTEITYVLDMGIISPLCFITLYLLKKKDELSYLLFWILLDTSFFIGILMVPQSILQYISGANLPLGAIISKSVIFMILALVAFKLKVNLKNEILESN